MNTKRNILLIYTGGTIGMIKDSETGALQNFNFDELLKYIPELNLLECNIASHSFLEPIDSSNMNPDFWVEIGIIIEDNYDTYDGFVVLHGSDTMSYTASALSFMLENLTKPVIFTGSQLPIGDLRTDAKENLITSIQIASLYRNNKPVITEVVLYFEYKLYRANRTTKVNAEHFEAFDSLNYPPLIISGVKLSINFPVLLKPNWNKKFVVHKILESNILLVKMFPGINKEIINHIFSYPNLKGLVLETYGSGNLTNELSFNNSHIEGKNIHSLRQSEYTAGAVKEYYLNKTINYQNDNYNFIGFIDGVLKNDEKIILEEIKTTSKEIYSEKFNKNYILKII